MGILLASEHQKSTFHLIFQSSDKKITHNTLIINALYTPPINQCTQNCIFVYIQQKHVHKINTWRSMWKKLGHLVRQPAGYKAYIPLPFPPQESLELSTSGKDPTGYAMPRKARRSQSPSSR